MTHDNLKAILDNLDIPVSKIETDLDMPSGTLAKAKKGVRDLPSKWDKVLSDYFMDNTAIPETAATKQLIEKNEATHNTKMVVDAEGFKEKPKKEYVNEVMDKINKDFGAGTVMCFGDKPDTSYQVISTGSLQLDIALGINGLPKGRMVEIYGAESSGKTTLALNVIANAQKQGIRCLLVDAENSFDPEYADALGVVVDELDYCQPSYGEQGFEVADRFISNGKAGVVVIDSVAAMIPKAELEGEMGDNKMGAHARLMSQVCRKLVGSVAKHNVLLIFINQIRNKIGAMFQSPEVTTGGMALQFYASVRLSVTRSISNDNSIMNGDIKTGNLTTVKVIKNKCAPPFKSAKFNIIYGEGIDRLSELVDVAVDQKVIDKSGSWYSFNGNKIGQGKESVKELLKDNPELMEEVKVAVMKSIKPINP